MSHQIALQATIESLVVPGKGILAADESIGTMGKRLEAVGCISTPELRRDYRELLLTADGLSESISGVILFTETLDQCSARGVPLGKVAEAQGLVPGVKVDLGLRAWGETSEKVTLGMDRLDEILEQYVALGARFAKWRAVFSIGGDLPTQALVEANVTDLARYAYRCHQHGVVPIVEPEVLMDGDHRLEDCALVTQRVLTALFDALERFGVDLRLMLLKPNMVVPGSQVGAVDPVLVARETLRVLEACVPASVPSINFLSGGLAPEVATACLNHINAEPERYPWQLSFSFGRALQAECLTAWAGKEACVKEAQAALLKAAKANAEAMRSGT